MGFTPEQAREAASKRHAGAGGAAVLERPAPPAEPNPSPSAQPDGLDLAAMLGGIVESALAPLREQIAELQGKAPRFQPMSPADQMGPAHKARNVTGPDAVAVGSYIPMDSRGRAVDPNRIWDEQRFETGMAVRLNRAFAKPGFGWSMPCLRDVRAANERRLADLERESPETYPAGSDAYRDALAAAQHEVDREVAWGDILDCFKTMRCTNRLPAVGGKWVQCRGVFDAGEPCPHCGEGPKVIGVGVLQVDGNYAGQQAYNVRVPGLTNRPEGQVFFDCELEPA